MSKQLLIPEKGRLLISAPFLTDVFKRSVVYITEHNDKGSVGFIINKPMNVKISSVIEDFPDFEAKIYYGGPVQQDMLNFFHKSGDLLDGGVELKDGIFWGGDFETLKLLVECGDLNPDDVRFFLGYAGWSPNQLDEELKIDSWFVKDSKPENVFNENPELLWQKVLNEMGGEYKIISTFPENPSVN